MQREHLKKKNYGFLSIHTDICFSLLGDWPNTYTFTKALAEQVVSKEGRGLPIAVFRPAVGQ